MNPRLKLICRNIWHAQGGIPPPSPLPSSGVLIIHILTLFDVELNFKLVVSAVYTLEASDFHISGSENESVTHTRELADSAYYRASTIKRREKRLFERDSGTGVSKEGIESSTRRYKKSCYTSWFEDHNIIFTTHELMRSEGITAVCPRIAHPMKEPLPPTPLPDYPWQRIATDMFTLSGHEINARTISAQNHRKACS